MSAPAIRQAKPGDEGPLNAGLAQLSAVLGDTHRATPEDLARALKAGVARALLAETRPGAVCGAALYSPVFSTRGGAAGVFVSDLWVSDTMRGTGLGRRLLIAAMRDGQEVWGAEFLKLTVADTNHAARAFYDRLGFRPAETDTNMFIDADALNAEETR